LPDFSKIEVRNKIDLGAKIASYPMPVTLIEPVLREKQILW